MKKQTEIFLLNFAHVHDLQKHVQEPKPIKSHPFDDGAKWEQFTAEDLAFIEKMKAEGHVF